MKVITSMTAAARLIKYKDAAAKYRDTFRNTPHPMGADWRYWRDRGLWEPRYITRTEKGELVVDDLGQLGYVLGDAHELTRGIKYTGWYADNSYGGNMVVGVVVRIRCPKGTLYVPATRYTECDGETAYIADAVLVPKGSPEEDHDEAARDAARTADGYAEREAETCREDASKEQAEMDIDEARGTIHELNKALRLKMCEFEFLMLRRAVKAGTAPQGAYDTLVEAIQPLLEARREQFALIEARTDNPWTAVPN